MLEVCSNVLAAAEGKKEVKCDVGSQAGRRRRMEIQQLSLVAERGAEMTSGKRRKVEEEVSRRSRTWRLTLQCTA
jgi:hypothetical protein